MIASVPHYALMGNPIQHSLSPIIHHFFARQTDKLLSYKKINVDLTCFEDEVETFFNQGGLGLNITSPFKERAFYLSKQRHVSSVIASSSNTLWKDKGIICSQNTDGIGLLRDLRSYIDLADLRVLILGAGGAARGIIGPILAEAPCELILFNRTLNKSYALQKDFPQLIVGNISSLKEPFSLIINATSPSFNPQEITLLSHLITKKTICYDLNYNPLEPTNFVNWANLNKCYGIDGLGMLVEQAAESFFIWHGIKPRVKEVINSLRKKPFF